MVRVVPERPGDAAAVEAVLDRAMGPGRHAKTAQRLRDANRPALGLVALAFGRPVGTLRLWPVIAASGHRMLLLGPLAVEPPAQGRGIGTRLMRCALARAAALGHGAAILVGDASYYGRFGFAADLAGGLELPGPVERARVLALELRPGALAGAAGLLAPAGFECGAVAA